MNEAQFSRLSRTVLPNVSLRLHKPFTNSQPELYKIVPEHLPPPPPPSLSLSLPSLSLSLSARLQANGANISEYHMNEICINGLVEAITKEEVRQSIRNLKHGKAPGLDNVCGEYPKNAETNITPFLTLTVNKINDSSCFPSDCANPL